MKENITQERSKMDTYSSHFVFGELRSGVYDDAECVRHSIRDSTLPVE